MSDSTTLQSFEELNRFFKERLSDERLYCGENYSFLKIFQHALSYEQMRAHERAIKNYMHWPLLAHVGVLRLKALLRKPLNAPLLKQLVCIDPARVVADEQGNWHSIYMERIGSLFAPESVTMLNRKTEPRLANRIALDQIPRNYGPPDRAELNMLREVHSIAQKTLSSRAWTRQQKRHILSALHLFFDDFRFYYAMFKNQPAKAVLFISHYHNEGLLAALRTLGIRSIELQHGLIAGNDLYYQYSPVFSKGVKNAFFPDKICVYGSYWKEILKKGCEFEESQIAIGGDYLWQPEQHEKAQSKEDLVLICAQKNFHTEYIDYAISLIPFMEKHPEWKWVIKMHPLEKRKSEYRSLSHYGFEIIDDEQSLHTLLSKARIHISIYSTTFYDALGYDVVNFSLQDFGTARDYALEMIREGVAHPLHIHEDPVARLLSGQLTELPLKRESVYGSFDEQTIRNLLTAPIN